MRIPTLLFMGSPQGSYITQNFNLSSNGTFTVYDNYGNSFSFTVPIAVSGVPKATIVGNSTTAVLETKVTAAAAQVADVKLAFSVYKQFCQPAGVRIEIFGEANWGPSAKGTVSLIFNHSPMSMREDRVWFGNTSGIALGFDWSDSASLSPAFNSNHKTLNYSVGPSFSIDPVTIGSGNSQSTYGDYQRLAFFAEGLYWAFYHDGTNIDYRTSSNGSIWSSAVSVRSDCGSGCFAVWYNPNSNVVYYASGTGTSSFAYRYGTPTTSGTISWTISETTQATTAGCNLATFPSIALDSNNNIWVAMDASGGNCGSAIYLQAFEYSTSWSTRLTVSGSYTVPGILVPLTGGKVALLYQSTSSLYLYLNEWTGSSWSGVVNVPGSGYIPFGAAAAIGDTVFFAVTDNTLQRVVLLRYPYGGPWSQISPFDSGSSTTVSADGAGNLIVFSAFQGKNEVVYNISSDGGSSWPNHGILSLNEPSANWIGSPFLIKNNLANAIWVSGSSAPYNVRFSAVPIVVPDASVSSKSWSKPGITPYASYFQNLGDYVSPGNGLLSVEQTDLQLPGRGIVLGLTRVYSAPYAFQASAPILSAYVTGSCSSSTSCITATLSATGSPILVYAVVLVDDGHTVSGLSSSPSLVWQKRSSVTLPSSSFTPCASSAQCDEETWYAVDPFPFSGTVTATATGSSDILVIGMGVAGVNTAPGKIFDSNPAVPCSGTATSGTATCDISTNNPGDLIIGAEANTWQTCSAGSPFTQVTQLGSSSGTELCLGDYAVSSTQSSLPVTGFTSSCSGSYVCAIIGDALTGAQPYEYDGYTATNLGLGWALNFPWFGTNYFHYLDGEAFPYQWGGNTFAYHGAVDFQLVNNGGSYTLYDRSGTTYQFNSNKQLVSITDHTGNNTVSFSYGSNGYISQMTDTIGRTVTFSYNSNNQLTSVSSGGRAWDYGYSGGNLASVTDPLNRVTTYQYSTGINNWLLSAVVYPTGGQTTYSYGSAPVGTEVSSYYVTARNIYSSSGVISRSDSFSYSVTNGLVTWSHLKSADGNQNAQAYQNYNFQTTPKSLMKTYDANPSNQTARETEYDYDAAGRINATKVVSPTGTVLATSIQYYDNWGNVIYTRDNVGQQTWFSYANTNSSGTFGISGCSASFYTQVISSNIHDLLVGRCDFQNGPGTLQQQTYYKYDRSGNLLEQKVLHNSGWLYTDYTHDKYGNVLTSTDALGRVTYYRYSSTYSSAYLTKQSILVGTQNVTTTYTYDSNTGNLLSTTDPNGHTTSYTYDALGRTTQVASPAVNGVVSYTNYYYYDNNNTMKTVDANGHVTKAYFDGLARQTEVQRWNGSAVYSAEYYTYNWLDEVATKTTATGSTYTYSYDWEGRLVKLTNPDHYNETTGYQDLSNGTLKTATDENGHQAVYSYNWNQWLRSVRQHNSSTSDYLTLYTYDLSGNMLSITDAKNQQTTYQYDDLNRLVTTTFPTSPSTQETRTYDNVGNLLTRTTANGSAISYTYDALNRLTKVTYPGSGGTVTYTYDADSNRLSMASPSATDRYTYDARDRLTNATEYVGGVKYQTLYAYDAMGDVTSLTYPDGYMLAMTYDGVNRLKKVGSFATVYYTVDDKTSTVKYGNGEVATYTYDSRDRPTQILDKYGSTKKMDLNYTYDGTGNVLTINGNAESYGYDYLSRLTSSSGPWGSITYTYDQAGNRLKTVNGSTTTVYCYGAYNRLTAYSTSSCSSPTISYTYDANGNTITKTGGWTYSYDYENRMTKVAQSGTTKQLNSYDGDGNRVKQVAGSSTFTYSYQGLNVLYEKNVTGGTTSVTKHFYAGGLQVAKMVGSTTYYLHQDALGSTRLETTSSVSVKFSSNYVPYGNNYAVSGKEVFMYTGEPYDSATGLYYMGARYYDPTTGRFVTQDSYAGSMNDPMSMNLYIYARDNPERYVDPTGHMYAGRMWTDYNLAPNDAITTTSSCTGGTCTVTTRESYDGYTSTTSTTFTRTSSSATQTDTWSTTMTDANPGGSARISTSTVVTSSTYTAPTIGIESYTSNPFTSECGIQPCHKVTSNQAGAWGAVIVSDLGWVSVGAAAAFGGLYSPILVDLTAHGAVASQGYVSTNIDNPDISWEGAAEAYGEGVVTTVGENGADAAAAGAAILSWLLGL